jgi:hypothetical protein
VKYLRSDKLFPAGFQPAAALKDGFMLLATSPDAIAGFRVTQALPQQTKEAMLMRISAPGLATLLEQRRDHIVSSLTDKQQMTKAQATRNLENVVSLLNLFENVTLSQHGEHGQATWIIRATPR